MKLYNLNINSHHHLENLNFDFAYPIGHPNAGEPLKQIYIIGQSATGKTNILELIKDSFKNLKNLEYFKNNEAHYAPIYEKTTFKGCLKLLKD